MGNFNSPDSKCVKISSHSGKQDVSIYIIVIHDVMSDCHAVTHRKNPDRDTRNVISLIGFNLNLISLNISWVKGQL